MTSQNGSFQRPNLFRFRSVNTTYWKEELVRLLDNGELYFSNRNSFSDPLDRNFPVANVSRNQIKQFIARHKRTIRDDIKLLLGESAKPDLRPNVVVRHFQSSANHVLRNSSIVCFTDELENDSQWDQYADGHCGIAYEFSQNDFGNLNVPPLPMLYVERISRVTVIDYMRYAYSPNVDIKAFSNWVLKLAKSPKEHAPTAEEARALLGGMVGKPEASWIEITEELAGVFDAFLNKYYLQKKLSYSWEREWRAITTKPASYQNLGKHESEDGPHLSLEAIYVGIRVSDEICDELMSLCGCVVPVYRMCYDENGSFVQIKIN